MLKLQLLNQLIQEGSHHHSHREIHPQVHLLQMADVEAKKQNSKSKNERHGLGTNKCNAIQRDML